MLGQPAPWEKYRAPAQPGEIVIPPDPLVVQREQREARNTESTIESRQAGDARAAAAEARAADAEARAAAAQGRQSQGQSFNQVGDLRKEFASDPQVRQFSSLRTSFEGLRATGEDASPQSDMALIFQFMRSLDPGSVVREAEYATAQNAAGVPDQIRNYYNRLLEGDKLNPKQRAEMIRIAREQYNAQAQTYNERADQYHNLLRQQGEDPYLHIQKAPVWMGSDEFGTILKDVGIGPAQPAPTAETAAAAAPKIDPAALAPMLGDEWRAKPLTEVARELSGPDQFYEVEEKGGRILLRPKVWGTGAGPEAEVPQPVYALQRGPNGRTYLRDVDSGEETEVTAPDISQVRNDEGGLGQRADAIVRGGVNAATLNFDDEIIAGLNSLTGGASYNDELAEQRAIDRYDNKNLYGYRLGGQLVGGVALPMGNVRSLGNLAARGAGYGGVYGAGEAGSLGQRGQNALMGAGVGAVAAPAVGALGNRVADKVSGALSGAPRAQRAATAEAAARQGATNSLMPQTVGGTGSQLMSGGISRTLGGMPMARGVQRELDAVQGIRDRTAGNMGSVTDRAGAGQAAQRGARDFETRAEARIDALEAAIPVPPRSGAVTTETQVRLQDLNAGFSSNPALAQLFRNPELERMQGALASGNLSWADLRAFRTQIGQMIGSPQVMSEKTTKQQLRSLYQALSTDMERTAAQHGPRAVTALRRAIQYERGFHSRRETVLRAVLGKNYDETAEGAYGAVTRMAREQGGDFVGLRRLMAAMPEDEANVIRASVFSRLGRATKGNQDETGEAFSINTFISNWNDMSPRARDILFRSGPHRQAVDDLVSIAAGVKRGQRFTNWSNTSAGVNYGGMGVGVAAGMWPQTLAYAALTYGAGKLLSSPVVTRALTRSARTGNAGGLSRQLTSIAGRNPSISQDVLGLRDFIVRAANDNMRNSGRAAAESGQNGSQDDQR